MKRILDVGLALVALLLFALPMLVIGLLLRYREDHPVIFRQVRVGRYRRPFIIFKFQTMVAGEPTPVGRWLRRTGLDELPQFINVLKGDMSIVGPRALTAADMVRLGWDGSAYDWRWRVRPGITGLAQIYGGGHRRLSSFWDRQYLRRSGPGLDLVLILISFLMNIGGKEGIGRLLRLRRSK
ncbi:MAG: sugar transferase [Victivallales bacterium]|nr:sugar transferase [Victivallales bacterium]